MHLCDFDDEIELLHLATKDTISQWEKRFTEAYQAIFAGDPYFEAFSEQEAETIYRSLTRIPGHITIIAVNRKGAIAGFGIAVPLTSSIPVSQELTGLIPVPHTMYFAELGVLNTYRGRGLGRALIKTRLNLINTDRYSHVVLRVAAEKNPSYDMYISMGFEDMGVYMSVSTKRIDGTLKTDQRLFLSRVRSQVKIES
jgi:ribosomal protein S18 acetylase RimI-like enzyme